MRLYNDLYELAGQPPGPSGQDEMFAEDHTEELSPADATKYRTTGEGALHEQ